VKATTTLSLTRPRFVKAFFFRPTGLIASFTVPARWLIRFATPFPDSRRTPSDGTVTGSTAVPWCLFSLGLPTSNTPWRALICVVEPA
jgi:hypothetical protein